MKILSKLKIASLFLLSLLFTLFTLITQVNANSYITSLPFYWDSIDVDIEVQNNGDMLVTETQEYIFNQPHTNQRYRYIPLDKVDDIKNVSVSENGNIIPFQFGRKNNQLWITWEHELNPPESHTFVIKYRVIGGLHLNSYTTQVYWKAIFSDRQSPIQNAKVTVKLPESLAGKITSFTHYAGNTPVSFQQLNSQTVEFVAQKPISQGKELEVQVTFPNNLLQMPQPQWQKNSNSIVDAFRSLISFFFKAIIFFFFVLLGSSGNRSNSSRSTRYYGGGGAGGGGSGGGGSGGGGGGGGGGG